MGYKPLLSLTHRSSNIRDSVGQWVREMVEKKHPAAKIEKRRHKYEGTTMGTWAD
jgi:hypothetical protein